MTSVVFGAMGTTVFSESARRRGSNKVSRYVYPALPLLPRCDLARESAGSDRCDL